MKRQELTDSLSVKQITVLLADDHVAVRKQLKLLVEADGDITVVAEAKNGRVAVDLTKSLQPEVVVMDVAMPLLNGLEATRQIMEISPATRVLILSAHPDPEYITQAVIFGASGYLVKHTSTQILAQAVRKVCKGNTFFDPSISKSLRDECQEMFDKAELLKKKTARR
jgi:DNA-binding NarL/FixJ family response regulator